MRFIGEFTSATLAIVGGLIALTIAIRAHWPLRWKIVCALFAVVISLASLLFKGINKRGVDDVLGEWLVDSICENYVVRWCPLPPAAESSKSDRLPTPSPASLGQVLFELSSEGKNRRTLSEINTLNGLLTVKELGKNPLDGQALYWKDNKLFEDSFVGIAMGYPENGPAEFVVVSTQCSGNRCMPYHSVVDMAVSPPAVIFTPIRERAFLARRRAENVYIFSGPGIDEKNKLGDPIEISLTYDRTRRLAIRESFDQKINYAKFVGRHPEELLGDAPARKPLFDLLKNEFSDFRRCLTLASFVELKEHRFLVSAGGSRDGDEAIFVIDVPTGGAWAALKIGNNSVRQFGQMPSSPGMGESDLGAYKWLRERGVRSSQ